MRWDPISSHDFLVCFFFLHSWFNIGADIFLARLKSHCPATAQVAAREVHRDVEWTQSVQLSGLGQWQIQRQDQDLFIVQIQDDTKSNFPEKSMFS